MHAGGWCLLGLLIAPAGCHAADPSALWKIVNGLCVPSEMTARDPSPCASVELAQGAEKGFAVLKDINGAAQFLLIPTARISGIEDKAILAPDATNYWDAAWRARFFVEERLRTTLSRDAIALAINSSFGRSQDQLHIHIDCVRPDVRNVLAANLEKIEFVWTPFPVLLAGQMYRAIRINQDSLDGIDPFQILKKADPDDMGKHTLVLIGATFADGTNGFVLLDDEAEPLAGNRASGEQLQDHSCAVATK